MNTSEGKCVLVEVGALISWCIYSYRIVMVISALYVGKHDVLAVRMLFNGRSSGIFLKGPGQGPFLPPSGLTLYF